jgi:putative transcriptional regulator
MKTKKGIAFSAKDLIGSLQEISNQLAGKKLTLRTREIHLPKPAKELRAQEIKAIRTKLHMSQPVFAAMLNIPVVTERSWEKGLRHPTGAALRLLEIAKNKPEALLKTAA